MTREKNIPGRDIIIRQALLGEDGRGVCPIPPDRVSGWSGCGSGPPPYCFLSAARDETLSNSNGRSTSFKLSSLSGAGVP